MLRVKWIGIYCGILLATTLLFTACGSSGAAPSNNTSSAAAPTKAAEPTATPEPTTAPAPSSAVTTTTATTTTETMTTTPAMTATESMTATSAMTSTGSMSGANEAAEVVVKVAEDPKLGKILVDAKGMTLYLFDKDTAGKSNCSGNCIKNWPALTVKDEAEKLTAGEGVTAKLEVIDRGDGTYQVTANGMPLYYYAKDANVGDTVGQGVGDVWWVLAPDGAKVTTK